MFVFFVFFRGRSPASRLCAAAAGAAVGGECFFPNEAQTITKLRIWRVGPSYKRKTARFGVQSGRAAAGFAANRGLAENSRGREHASLQAKTGSRPWTMADGSGGGDGSGSKRERYKRNGGTPRAPRAIRTRVFDMFRRT